ncbi:uroporphyrinogen-III synthase [Methylophilaceae bacterium]|nr:uroporphyrinogen-III synthase [Methylophilaceae bacterium]
MNRPKKIVLISTRPHRTNVQLSDDLKNSEIKLLSFPLTEIYPLNNYQIFDGVIENIKTYQHIIFISTNAVHFFLERVKKLSLQIPKNLIFSSIGPTTKLSLQKKLSVDVHSPIKTFDSEHLLKEKIYNNVKGQKILIIRGEGGRETLKNALEEKGAIVNYGECYVRKYVDIDLNQLKNDLVNYHQQFFLFSSTNSVKHFIRQLSNVDKHWLQNIKIIVNHKKIEGLLSKIFKNIFVCNNIDTQNIRKLIVSEGLD